MAGSRMKHRSETLKNNRYDPSPTNRVSGLTTIIMIACHFPVVLLMKYFHHDDRLRIQLISLWPVKYKQRVCCLTFNSPITFYYERIIVMFNVDISCFQKQLMRITPDLFVVFPQWRWTQWCGDAAHTRSLAGCSGQQMHHSLLLYFLQETQTHDKSPATAITIQHCVNL